MLTPPQSAVFFSRSKFSSRGAPALQKKTREKRSGKIASSPSNNPWNRHFSLFNDRYCDLTTQDESCTMQRGFVPRRC